MRKKYIHYLQAILFMCPSIVILVLFVYKPLASSLGYAFVNFENFIPKEFVGFDNFRKIFGDKVFWNSLQLTFKWVLMNALLPTVLGLLFAVLLEFLTKRQILTEISRVMLFMPQMMSLVAVGLLWKLIYDPNIGMISGLAALLGFKGKLNILGNVNYALYYSFIPVIWQSAGFSMVIFSAALQGVSQDILEAAVTEGATKCQQIRFVMIPSIMNTILTVISINMITGFKAFDLLYTLTKGGPGTSTNISAIYSYTQAFQSYRFDYASAVMVMLLAAVIVMLVIFNLITKPIKKKYGT